MIKFDKFTLDNGLKVIVHKDDSTPMAVVNLLYDVGSKDENPERTGFAHLFEHLMFGGSKNVPDFERPLLQVGGENNAFTSNDITNYYITLPKENLETAFWMESDRMLSLNFTQKSLEVQQGVVIEEYKQRYLNQPYGDAFLLMRPLAYKTHPYRWATIGKDISHIENANLEDVKEFFYKHYAPNNAILVVAGNVETKQVKELAEKWFAPIKRRDVPERNLPQEPRQTEARTQKVEKDVPIDAIYKSYHICNRTDEKYYATDLISDVLSNGQSSRLFQTLVKEQRLFTSIDAAISGDIENGLFYVTGHLTPETTMEQAEAAIEKELTKISTENVSDYELDKVKNKFEANFAFSQTSILSIATNLAYFELFGDASDINLEIEKYRKVTADEIRTTAAEVFRKDNCSTLYYYSKSNQ